MVPDYTLDPLQHKVNDESFIYCKRYLAVKILFSALTDVSEDIIW